MPRASKGVFLAVDLTPAVAEELLAKDVNTAIIYHPVIFSPVRSLTMANPLQSSILKCIASGISIYCPHTTLDVIDGGINDWIAAGLQHPWEKEALSDDVLYRRVRDGSGAEPCEKAPNARTPTEGIGRAFTLSEPCTLAALVERAKRHFGIEHVQIAEGVGKTIDTPVQKVAVCAGSGASVLKGSTDADVWVSGELGHHDILAANAQGISVIVTNHTNTERRFFRTLFAPLLREQLPELTVYVSDADRDPLRTV